MGGYSQVDVELFLLKKAVLCKYDYYHLLSGQDLLIVNNDIFDDFFESHNTYEFISFNEKLLENNPEIKRRTRYYHFLQNYRRRYKEKWKNQIFIFLERCSLLIQMLLHVDRTKKIPWKIKYGPNWFSITNNLAVNVIEQEKDIKKVFSYTNCADELLVQTIAYNFGYMSHVYPDGNMRYIDWTNSKNGSPYTFRRTDYARIVNSGCLIARKFSEKVDSEIISEIINFTKE